MKRFLGMSMAFGALLMAAGVMSAGCGSSTPAQTCSPFSSPGASKCGTLQACCSTSSCSYTSSVSGKGPWNCNGTDCSAAAMQLIKDCM